MDSNLLYLPLIIRPLIAVCTRSFFQPDEYFQALEPAHRLVFGYGHLTWEWMADPPIRSIAYPAIWFPIYLLLKVTGMDYSNLLIYGPRFLSGLLAALTDIYAWKLASNLFGRDCGRITITLSLSSLFHVLALSRTLSNSIETSLTTMALYYWPFPTNKSPNLGLALALSGLSVFFRPTSAVLWIFMGVELIIRTIRTGPALVPILSRVLIIGTLYGALLFGLDSVYYQALTFTPLNFLRVNLSSVSSFYGANQWHYYLTQAIPVLCTTALPFVVHGAKLAYGAPGAIGETSRILLALSAWTIGVYSVADHKEWRFIHPLLPIFHVFASISVVKLSRSKVKQRKERFAGLSILPGYLLLILSTLPASIYVIFFHSHAQIDVMYQLRSIPSAQLHSIGFLMPCHSTPWQAYLHRPSVEMWAIGCEPPLRGQNLSTYRDQTRVFYDDPVEYLHSRFPVSVDHKFPLSPRPSSTPGNSLQSDWHHSWPSHLAFFGALLEQNAGVREILAKKGYRLSWRSSNGWEEDDRRRGGVELWTWSSPSTYDG